MIFHSEEMTFVFIISALWLLHREWRKTVSPLFLLSNCCDTFDSVPADCCTHPRVNVIARNGEMGSGDDGALNSLTFVHCWDLYTQYKGGESVSMAVALIVLTMDCHQSHSVRQIDVQTIIIHTREKKLEFSRGLLKHHYRILANFY